MKNAALIKFKIADRDGEFEQIHRLNYQTFVEEIPQHQVNPAQRLVDKFHEKNTYAICVLGNRVIGMLALCSARPFSLESKLDDLQGCLPAHKALCEIRLLAVERAYRNTLVFTGLIRLAMDICMTRQYDLAVISATTRQLKLYRHLGFVAFAERVGTEQARYQPMYLDLKTLPALIARSQVFKKFQQSPRTAPCAERNYLPGPVELRTGVCEAFTERPISHRSQSFMTELNVLQKHLCQQFAARQVQLFNGSGTLANDIIACYLQQLGGCGVILVNGEFSHRLTLHAKALGLEYYVLSAEQGWNVENARLRDFLETHPQTTWLWTVACETSSGVLADLEQLKSLCHRYSVRLCLDAVSALGSIPLDLSQVYMASAVSGKGLGSLSGVAMVFHDDLIVRADAKIPRYFNLHNYQRANGVPFTLSSNAIRALACALQQMAADQPDNNLDVVRQEILSALAEYGVTDIAKQNPAPHILSLRLPGHYSSRQVGDAIVDRGFWLSYESEYLLRMNALQICLMGNFVIPDDALINAIKQGLHRASPAQSISECHDVI